MLGSVIIKHKLNVSDEETVQTISENPYMQYFLGLDEFSTEPLFPPSLLVDFRKRMGSEDFGRLTEVLMRSTSGDGADGGQAARAANKGRLKLDATVADQYIRYPNDLGLLNEAREKTEAVIGKLYGLLGGRMSVKPRTYRKVARQSYLKEAKKKQRSEKTLRPAIRYQLNCLDRNLRSIEKMVDMLGEWPLSARELREVWVVRTLNDQQRGMYSEGTNSCEHRIVSTSQPHVRPIVRGKQVEFGAKISLSLANGYARADRISWEAFHEAGDLPMQAEAYKSVYGHCPELIRVDKLYATNANRKWCSERGIRLTAAQKGPKQKESPYQKKKRKKEYSERNEVEGKIGQAKQGYELNRIKAKLKDTSLSWIGAVIFITNLVQFARCCNFHF